jgi:hypothetical protein
MNMRIASKRRNVPSTATEAVASEVKLRKAEICLGGVERANSPIRMRHRTTQLHINHKDGLP